MAKFEFVGVGITGSKYLTVYIDVEVNGVVHPESVKVPWSTFTANEIAYHINLAHAHRLRLMWENGPPPWQTDDALPGIG